MIPANHWGGIGGPYFSNKDLLFHLSEHGNDLLFQFSEHLA